MFPLMLSRSSEAFCLYRRTRIHNLHMPRKAHRRRILSFSSGMGRKLFECVDAL
jgi:hypothetical protein